MDMKLAAEFEKPYAKKRVTSFQVGDTVDVHVRIIEREMDEGLSKTVQAIKKAQKGDEKGPRERIQVFTGVVIARKGSGVRETFTVRRIVQGEGVERVFPIHSPRVARIRVRRRGRVRRAKLNYLRERTGKATRLREVRLGTDFQHDADDTPEARAEAAAAKAAAAKEKGEEEKGKKDKGKKDKKQKAKK